MKRIVLVGASGHGKVCAEIAKLNGYKEILFLDDNPLVKRCNEYEVVGSTESLHRLVNSKTDFFVSIGDSRIRESKQDEVKNAGGNIVSLIHPNAVVSPDVEMGIGTVIMPGVVVNTGSYIGNGVIINTCSSVDHDCSISDYCHVAVGAHICGTVKLNRHTWVGAGSTISNNIKICEDVVIGAGAVVVSDIKESGTYVGAPSKQL